VCVCGCVTVFWGMDTSPSAYSVCLYNNAQSWLSLLVILPDAIMFLRLRISELGDLSRPNIHAFLSDNSWVTGFFKSMCSHKHMQIINM